ncbi:MAG: DUF547 domain-containing protein [Saprospiraceae bacterium]|nr:DUF547 domain-containing protein [Saprospiraceae bacterium]
MFDAQQFSIDLKIQKAKYINNEVVDTSLLERYIHFLQQVDLTTLESDVQKCSFWINVYNGLTNYWIIEKKIKKSMLERPLLVMCAKILIGKYKFSLDDIEHGILRSNQRSRYKLWKQFSNRDPRKKLKTQKLDPRIHFALNCGAKSCPPIAFYTQQRLDQELHQAEASFVDQEFLVDNEQKKIQCSRIFWLYRSDFVDTYLNDPKYKDYKVSYNKYNFAIV